MGFPSASVGKEPACNVEDARGIGSIPGLGRSPGEGHSNHSSILAWRIPWTEEPGGLQPTGDKESGVTEHAFTHTHNLESNSNLDILCFFGKNLTMISIYYIYYEKK